MMSQQLKIWFSQQVEENTNSLYSLAARLTRNSTDATLIKFKHHLDHCESCCSRSELEGISSERIKTASKGKTPKSLKNRLYEMIDKL